MLRVQRYEMLLKALVIDSVAFGTVDTAPLNQQRRKAMFASKPMGYFFDEQPFVSSRAGQIDTGRRGGAAGRTGRSSARSDVLDHCCCC
jgi:hypothetical protein